MLGYLISWSGDALTGGPTRRFVPVTATRTVDVDIAPGGT